MPTAPPSKNQAAVSAGNAGRATRLAVRAAELIRKIPINEVARAEGMGMAVTSNKAGTNKKPPPTPKIPDSTPVIAPAATNLPAQDQANSNRPVASWRQAQGESGTSALPLPPHIFQAIRIISRAKSPRVSDSGQLSPNNAPSGAPATPPTPTTAPSALPQALPAPWAGSTCT